MINIRDIEALLVEWTETFTGLATGQVIIAEDNGPKPDLPYIALRIQNINKIGTEVRSNPYDFGGSAAIKISGNREMVVNFQAYGTNSYGILEDLWHRVHDELSRTLLANEGLALIEQLALTNLTGLNDTDFEERAQQDLMFRFATQLEDIDVGVIETVDVSGQLKNPDKTIDINIDLT